MDAEMTKVPRGTVGHLALRGPTGWRYLADARQTSYVRDGWNLAGDSFWQDEDGCFHLAARIDDMIISACCSNIAEPEVEAARLLHCEVTECAVVGAPDEERGQIVQAHIVLASGVPRGTETAKRQRDHVRAKIAPYKYPCSIGFIDALPRTPAGKVQCYRLRRGAR